MKIINSHLHIIEADVILKDRQKLMDSLKYIPSFKNAEQSIALLTPEVVLDQMAEAGIDKSVVYACKVPILYSSNEFVSGICRKYPDKFIGFASVDPKSKDAPNVLENAVKVLGLKGLKLHPPMQDFFPNDHIAWPVYDMASSLGIPIAFHVGSTPFGSMVKLAQAYPILIDEIAVAFPNLKIILTHMGTLWHNEAFMVAEKNPNVYLDTAAYPKEIKQLLTMDLIERVGANKFIFGTDFPMPYENKTHRMKDYVDTINSLPISQDAKEDIFYRNFERLMKVD